MHLFHRAQLLAVRQRWTAVAQAETGEGSRVCCVGAAADDAQQLLRMLCTGTYHVPADRCSRPYLVATSLTQVRVTVLRCA